MRRDDGELLRVLAAEVGAARPDDREQLRDDGRDAVEVRRAAPCRTGPSVSPATCTVVQRRARVHLGGVGREHAVDARFLAQPRDRSARSRG